MGIPLELIPFSSPTFNHTRRQSLANKNMDSPEAQPYPL